MRPPPPSPRPPRASRRWTVVGRTGAVDVDVLARDDERLDDVLPPLVRALGLPQARIFSGTTRLAGDVCLADVRLRHGAVLGLDRTVGDPLDRSTAGALELRVVGGTDAGRIVPLDHGSHVLGRGDDVEVHLDDPNVSRRHVVVHVAGGTVEVTDLGSSNGTVIDGRAVADRSSWRIDHRLRIGATTLQVAAAHDAPAAVTGSTEGRTILRRAVTLPDVRAPVEVVFPQPPAPPAVRRPPWLAAALPAVAGISLAVALQAPTFLFFALLSPLVAVASWWSDRRSGRRAHRRDLRQFEQRTADARARLAAAVQDDARVAHRRLPDLAALTSAVRRRTSLVWVRGAGHPDHLTIRVGAGPGATTVVVRSGTEGSGTAPADDLPVPVDLRHGGLSVVAPRARALGVLRSAIGQIAALHSPDAVDLVLVTSPPRLADWRWVRWLPHVCAPPVLVADEVADGAAAAGPRADSATRSLLALVEQRRAAGSVGSRQWSGRWTVVVVDVALPGSVAAALTRTEDIGLTLLSHGSTAAQVPVPAPALLTVTGELGTAARLQVHGAPPRAGVAIDQLPLAMAASLARDLAGIAPQTGRSALPRGVRYLDVARPGTFPLDDLGAVHWTSDRASLVVALGVGADGPELVDLCRSGPHALVAGTTGAGKSELLQTLVAGLALAHPPDRCSFLLVDYKGGAAFAEAADLPHTVGLLTDLDDATTTRALRSLTAELTRREMLLAAHAVADIAHLPEQVPLARLVIVVDEFATLAEELPAFVPGLVAIAQRGRSLGIHLVLATQRPAGVVSPDIRANCTLRICLRTTDEADSRDVLGTPDAAHLPVDLPGRAFVRTGTGAPRLLQVARVSQPPPADQDAPLVRTWCWPAPPPEAVPSGKAESDLAHLVGMLARCARNRSSAPPHRPWRPALPATLSLSEAEELTGAGHRQATELLIGVLDRPERQEQRALVLDLAEGGGWLVVGGPRSGRTTLLRSVLGQAAARVTADRLHVHVVDGGSGGLATAASHLPFVGTAIAGVDALRCVRLVHRLGQEVARRRATGVSDEPHILLLVDAVESLCGVLDESDPAHGSVELLRLVRDGGAVGVTCVLTADRAVPGGRLAGIAQNRLVLPLPDRVDYAVAGIPLAAVPSDRPPGRALLGEDGVECQLVRPEALAPVATATTPVQGRHPAPLRIVELTPDPRVDGTLANDARSILRVAVGPGGDEGDTLSADLLPAGGLLVVGPPGSGRSATLDAMVGDLTSAGVPVLRLLGPLSKGRGRVGEDTVDLSDPAAVGTWLDGHGGEPAVVCVDDLGPAGTAPALTVLPHLGAGSGIVLIATATAGDLSSWFQGPVAGLRRRRSGLLLCPGPGDADVLGARLPRTPVPVRPGAGWLVDAGTPTRVQAARHRVRAPAAQSSSRAGPISCVAYQASS